MLPFSDQYMLVSFDVLMLYNSVLVVPGPKALAAHGTVLHSENRLVIRCTEQHQTYTLNRSGFHRARDPSVVIEIEGSITIRKDVYKVWSDVVKI